MNIPVHQSKEIKRKEWNFRRQRKKDPSSRIRTSDLRMTTSTLQSSALPTELSKEPRNYIPNNSLPNYTMCTLTRGKLKQSTDKSSHTNQNTSERNKNFFRLLKILLFLTFSAIYSVFLFF